MENKLIENAKMLLKNPKYEFRLLGGMSNIMVVVSDVNEKYTVREVGRGAEHFTNREEELYHIKMFEKLNITNKTLYFDKDTGIKIAKYIEGDILSFINPNDHLKEVSDLLKVVHNGPLSKYDYNYFKRLDYYESINDNVNKEFYELKDTLLKYKNEVYQNIKLTLTHGDSQPSNFILGKERLYLVDFEFSGNNDPFYDIACFGNKDINNALLLLEVYLEKKPSNSDLHRLYYYRAQQTLQWYLVALYKEKIGLSIDLKIDFLKVSENYLKETKRLIKEMEKLE